VALVPGCVLASLVGSLGTVTRVEPQANIGENQMYRGPNILTRAHRQPDVLPEVSLPDHPSCKAARLLVT
jgi:hypothetical protein